MLLLLLLLIQKANQSEGAIPMVGVRVTVPLSQGARPCSVHQAHNSIELNTAKWHCRQSHNAFLCHRLGFSLTSPHWLGFSAFYFSFGPQ